MYEWGQACIFSGLVGWEKAKRYLHVIRHRASQSLDFFFQDDSNEEDRRRAVWGQSAPSLDAPPIPLNRPISQRVLSAWLLCRKNISESPTLQPCTEEFRTFLNEKNLLKRRRSDIFHNFLENFTPASAEHSDLVQPAAERKLLVFYKNGVREFAVVYKKDIVFPPSVSQKAVPEDENCLDVLNASFFDITVDNITKISKQLKGPGRDFYRGSTYETTVFDICLVSCAQKILSVRDVSEGCDDLETLWLFPPDANNTKLIILHNKSEKVITKFNYNTPLLQLI